MPTPETLSGQAVRSTPLLELCREIETIIRMLGDLNERVDAIEKRRQVMFDASDGLARMVCKLGRTATTWDEARDRLTLMASRYLDEIHSSNGPDQARASRRLEPDVGRRTKEER